MNLGFLVDIFVSYTLVSYTRFGNFLQKNCSHVLCHTRSDTLCHTLFYSGILCHTPSRQPYILSYIKLSYRYYYKPLNYLSKLFHQPIYLMVPKTLSKQTTQERARKIAPENGIFFCSILFEVTCAF